MKIAFTDIGTLELRSKVYSGDKVVGEVFQLMANENVDTIFVVVKLTQGIKVPKGSKFYIKERVLSNAILDIEFSKEKIYFTLEDKLVGDLRPVPAGKTVPIDSLESHLKELLKKSN